MLKEEVSLKLINIVLPGLPFFDATALASATSPD